MAGSLKTLNIYQNGSSIYEASTFVSYGIWTDGNKIYKTNNHTPQSGDTELVTLTTTISGLYHNADGEQVSVGLNTVLVITTIAATDIIVYCVNASIKTTLDLSTLSDIADGTHTVKVKAKANGYNDSEFSNEVSYTKVPAGYSGTITSVAWDVISGIDPDGRGNLISMESSGTLGVGGYPKYAISYSSSISNHKITANKCTYIVDKWNSGYEITPLSNGFTFTVTR